MPVKVKRLRSTGLVFIDHTCEDCGEYANFGIDVSFRNALNQMVIGKTEEGEKLLGKWYCEKHKKETYDAE